MLPHEAAGANLHIQTALTFFDIERLDSIPTAGIPSDVMQWLGDTPLLYSPYRSMLTYPNYHFDMPAVLLYSNILRKICH